MLQYNMCKEISPKTKITNGKPTTKNTAGKQRRRRSTHRIAYFVAHDDDRLGNKTGNPQLNWLALQEAVLLVQGARNN